MLSNTVLKTFGTFNFIATTFFLIHYLLQEKELHFYYFQLEWRLKKLEKTVKQQFYSNRQTINDVVKIYKKIAGFILTHEFQRFLWSSMERRRLEISLLW